jgi:hypothetical protein
MTEIAPDYNVPARTPPDGWKAFGWQGVSCVIPDEWDASGITGTTKRGYFTFDDDRSRRLEIKFDQAKRFGQPSLDRTLEDYFKAVRKQLGKKGTLEVDHDIELLEEATIPDVHNYRTYGWTSEMTGRGIIWHCPVCRRVVIAQCLADKNRVNLREMSQVLTSIRCHSDANSDLWAIFDFAVDIPDGFVLQVNKLQAGLISLEFYGARRRLVVDRVGLVQAILAHSTIDNYVEKTLYKKLRRRRLRFSAESWRGHEGFLLEGERFRLGYFIPILGQWLRSLRKSDHIGGRIWHSEDANRLYVIRVEGRDPQLLADAVADSIVDYIDGSDYDHRGLYPDDPE